MYFLEKDPEFQKILQENMMAQARMMESQAQKSNTKQE